MKNRCKRIRQCIDTIKDLLEATPAEEAQGLYLPDRELLVSGLSYLSIPHIIPTAITQNLVKSADSLGCRF